ncbi:MAG: helix-turn-helix transcriptional regulator [Anaeroplasma sp.]|uniref:helix-turn-helix domain-containing protein n=1 Tax=Anaeroplasma sp. TaxID=1872523 RepID=UPI002A917748|nr:helix-turn-helix transcriptional regulator [Anaeroplasma sp.]MDY5982693.1 helix-turn-helix transcriptional regulator [Anaeroplasma sp.]
MNIYLKDYRFIADSKITGKEIKKHMKLNNMSANDLLDKLYEIDPNVEVGDEKTIYKWTLGNSLPKIETLEKVAKVFNVTLDDLLLPDLRVLPAPAKDDDILSSIKSIISLMISNNDKEPINHFEFDKDKPIISDDEYKFINFDKAINYIRRFDYLVQKKFLSFPTPLENEELIDTLRHYDKYNDDLEKYINDYIKEISSNYGVGYRLNVNNEMKNELLFSFYYMFSPLSFNKQIRDYLLFYLILNDIKNQEALVNLLLPFEKCMVYTVLKVMNLPELKGFIKLLENYDVKQLKFSFPMDKINDQLFEFKMILINEDKQNIYNSINKNQKNYNMCITFRLLYDYLYEELLKIKTSKEALELLED